MNRSIERSGRGSGLAVIDGFVFLPVFALNFLAYRESGTGGGRAAATTAKSSEAWMPDAAQRTPAGRPLLTRDHVGRKWREAVEFQFDEALPVLRRTPAVLRALLLDLPAPWTGATEGPGTWSPFDVVGHLIHGERTDWMPRVGHMLQHGDSVPFPAFDREAMFAASKGLALRELLDTFGRLRTESLDRLVALSLTDADLTRRGRHPELGVVTLGQHLATWMAHDLSHVGQVVRVMARQYSTAVGPWRAYLPILGSA